MAKAGIHPTYYPKAGVTCSCGAKFEIGSTKDSLRVDICRECHPFYSGNQKLIDTAGRVDRFRERMATAEAMQAAKPAKKSRNKDEVVEEVAETPAPAAEEVKAETVEEPKTEEVVEEVENEVAPVAEESTDGENA